MVSKVGEKYKNGNRRIKSRKIIFTNTRYNVKYAKGLGEILKMTQK